jgi:two-component system LytT family sensor kinase
MNLPRWARRALVLVALWSIPGVLQATSMYVVYQLKQDPMPLLDALAWRVPSWWVWALATPLIVTLGRRFVLTRRPWLGVPIHLVANAAIASAELVVYIQCGRLVGEDMFLAPVTELVPWMLLKNAFLEVMIYWGVIAADAGLAYQRRYREAALRQSQLEARLVEAQLDALKMQLHPHFLFNTINAIAVLIRKGETASALHMLGGMSELLRRSLSSLKVEHVSLRNELEFIQRYLDIETTRFPDRLKVSLAIEPGAEHARVPVMLLQPIVENAIKHGIAPRIRGGTIAIAARITGDRLRIEVRDDGVGLAAVSPTAGQGVGLSHVRKRLAQLYGEASRFSLEPNEPSGAIAIVELPSEEES